MTDIQPGDMVRCIRSCPQDAKDEPWAFPPGEGSVWKVETVAPGCWRRTHMRTGDSFVVNPNIPVIALVGDTLRWPGARPLDGYFVKLNRLSDGFRKKLLEPVDIGADA